MVLLTPFLMLMAALMICFGDAALWKIRAQATVHYAGTQTEPFRGSQFDGASGLNPRPASWPRPASLGGRGGADINSVQDLFWNQTGTEDTAALQGSFGSGSTTTLVDPYMGNQFVVNRTMIADRGVNAGAAAITKPFPMLTRILPPDGRFRVDLQSESLTGDWYFTNVGLGWNTDRRADHLYDIDPGKIPQLNQLWNDFLEAFNNLKSNPTKRDLDPLDDDPEWSIYHPGSRPPDFHPPRPTGCEIDLLEYITSGDYEAYLQRIRRVPLRMAQAWYSTYHGEWSARQNPMYVPKGPLSDAELERRFNLLQDYTNRLRANGYQ